MIVPLNLPKYNITTKQENEKTFIFDFIRKKYLQLTPEEWVRQNFLHYLVKEKKFPASLIAVEKAIRYNGLTKRADIVIYDKSLNPLVIVECKAPEIKIKEETFYQIARYNKVLETPFLIVTNGIEHYCCTISSNDSSISFLEKIPLYSDIIKQMT